MPTTSIDRADIRVEPISRRELLAYRADVKGEIFRQIRRHFNRLKNTKQFSQKILARRLGMDEGLLSRRLNGENDMQLESLSDLARGLECRIDVNLTPLEDVTVINYVGGYPVKFVKAEINDPQPGPRGGVKEIETNEKIFEHVLSE